MLLMLYVVFGLYTAVKCWKGCFYNSVYKLLTVLPLSKQSLFKPNM